MLGTSAITSELDKMLEELDEEVELLTVLSPVDDEFGAYLDIVSDSGFPSILDEWGSAFRPHPYPHVMYCDEPREKLFLDFSPSCS